jgi:putative RNA 2'-phosphotransferase
VDERKKQLSKTISYALRHQPEAYGLQLDAEGWVPIEALLDALHQRKSWQHVCLADINTILAESDKQRFEMGDGRIRALYGHSVSEKVKKQAAVPPEILYHGTTSRAAVTIHNKGLLPMKRQYVHLSTDEKTARQVALRRTNSPVILRIAALKAHQQGVHFYPGNENVWLADAVPPAFISR